MLKNIVSSATNEISACGYGSICLECYFPANIPYLVIYFQVTDGTKAVTVCDNNSIIAANNFQKFPGIS